VRRAARLLAACRAGPRDLGRGPRERLRARGGGKLGRLLCFAGPEGKGAGLKKRKSLFLFIPKGLNQNLQHLYNQKLIY